MQTTLLGLAIAFIIALVAALIGPQFIDWNQFRPQFEAEASRVLGTPVRVTGTLDARLLPTPILRLQTVEVGGTNSSSKLSADQLEVSFALGSLMRGEVRADELSLDGFNLDLGLDRRGRIDWPLSAGRMDIGGLAIDKLNAAGRISVHDAASNATLNLDDVVFSGDVRALAGTMRGDGKFSIGGVRSPFKISSGQSADGKGTRLRLTIDPGDRGILADLDGVVTLEAMTPRFDGNVTLARTAATAKKSVSGEKDALMPGIFPWRLTSRVTAGSASATLAQIEVNYGPDASSLKLTGLGDIRFGPAPVLRASLSSRQLDVDRLFVKDDASVQTIDVIPDVRALIASLPVPPLPMQLEINADQIALGGRPVQNVSATLRGNSTQWTIDHLGLLAPGATQVTVTGTVAPLGDGARLSGPIDIQSADPGVLAEWLGVKTALSLLGQKPFAIHGDATLAIDRFAIDNLKADLDGGAIEGRVVASPSDVQIVLKADQFDLDRIVRMAGAMPQSQISSLQKQWPDQTQVSLDIAQARLLGRDIRPVALQFSLAPKALSLDRLKIGEESGRSLSGAGALDRTTAIGKLDLKASAASLADVGGLIEALSPDLAARLKAVTAVTGPVQATMALTSEADPADAGRAKLRAVVHTDVSQIKASTVLTAAMAREKDGGLSFADLASTDVHLDTMMTSPQTDRLVALLGLDRIVAADTGPAQMTSSIEGKWRAPLTIKAGFTSPKLELNVQGKGDPWSDQLSGTFKVTVDRADIAPLVGLAPGGTSAFNVSLSSQLAIAGQTWTFDDIDSRVGSSQLHGRVAVTRGGDLAGDLGGDLGINGQISADTVDLPSVLMFAVGAAGRDRTAPLGRGLLQGWRGKLAVDAARASVTQDTVIMPLNGVIASDGQAFHAETTKAGIGGGTASLGLDLAPSPEDESVSAKLQLTNVDASALTYRKLTMPPSRVSMQASVITRGRSAEALAGALSGAGILTLDNLHLAGLDPDVFEAASHASESAQVTDDARLKDLIDPLLTKGRLDVPSAQIPFSVKDGRLSVADTQFAASNARVAVSGGYDMPADQVNIRAALSQPEGSATGAPGLTVFLLGTPDKLVRSIDVSSLSSWLAIRAIDRETKRLDELNRDPSQALLPPQVLPSETPTLPDAAPKRDTLPSSNVKLPKARPRRPDAASSNAALPPLPPAIDVQPTPGAARPPKPRPPLQIAPASSF